LIGQYDSPFVRRVAIAFRFYGLPFEHRPWSTFGEGDKIAVQSGAAGADAGAPVTSPRLRGEVGAKRRVRGILSNLNLKIFDRNRSGSPSPEACAALRLRPLPASGAR
jgi:hypothetical protein